MTSPHAIVHYDPTEAFDHAIKRWALPGPADDYMYMGTENRGIGEPDMDLFKHIDTRRYIRVPR